MGGHLKKKAVSLSIYKYGWVNHKMLYKLEKGTAKGNKCLEKEQLQSHGTAR